MKSSRIVVFAAVALCAAQASASMHTVTFRKMNGTVLQTFKVEHGANATSLMPAVPTESGMTANGWDHADWLASVTNDVTCWALYEASTAMSPSTSIASQPVADRETPYSLDEYFKMYDNLAWSDEFSGTSLDVGTSTWWGGSTGGTWQYDTWNGDEDLAEYTAGQNHIVSDGTYKIICRRESETRITSEKVNTKGKVAFTYGRCEMRAKLTKQMGGTPAFWTMGSPGNWPQCGEIDIMEQVNGSDWIGGTIHMPHSSSGSDQEVNHGLVAYEDGVHWGDGFHRIGIILNERELVWYVDDHIYHRMDIRDAKYDILRNYSQYLILNLNFGGGWAGQTSPTNSTIIGFVSENFEVDYCRIFTNTNAENTVSIEPEPAGARLSGPVKATAWRGWQMNWGKPGANYYQGHLVGSENHHVKTALREYLGRDGADVVTFITRPQNNSGGGKGNSEASYHVPGYTTVNLSPNSGMGYNSLSSGTQGRRSRS